MKKILITLSAITSVLTACKDDHVCPTPTPTPIVVEKEVNVDFIGEYSFSVDLTDGKTMTFTYTFNEDSTYYYESKMMPSGEIHVTHEGTWTIADEQPCEDAIAISTSYLHNTYGYDTRLYVLSVDEEWLNFHRSSAGWGANNYEPACAVYDRIRIK